MLPFAAAIFLGAFLLFQVQPLIGKYILPWFGGGPGVWTTCLLFFQVALLAGYAYAHALTRWCRPRTQAWIHGVLLVAAAALLPIAPGEFWRQHVAGNPTWHIALLLGGTIGLPYVALAATGPLLQQWFGATRPGVSPYRLYALSNLASLLALLSYPAFFEVRFSRYAQALGWSCAFGVFAVVCGYCAWRRARAGDVAAPRVTDADPLDVEIQAPSVPDRVLWIALPATASVLLLATTNKLCQDIAVIPFLWVVPLSVYLLSFVLAFDHPRWYPRGVTAALLTAATAVVFLLLPNSHAAPIRLQIVCYTIALFLACLFCHGELYRLKPPPRHLTGFYLAIAIGGAIGGVLVAIVAPRVFTTYHEQPIGYAVLAYLAGVLCLRHESRELAFAAAAGVLLSAVTLPLVRSQLRDGLTFGDECVFLATHYGWVLLALAAVFLGTAFDPATRRLTRVWRPRLGGFVMLLSVVAGVLVIMRWRSELDDSVVHASRNFYGTLTVYDYEHDDPPNEYRMLVHGATTHGLQFLADDKAMRHTSYYGETSGVGLALKHLAAPPGHRRIGLVGLGTGTLASYGTPGDYLRIYDINPAVIALAHTEFTYLRRCPAKVDVVLGDARLSLERELSDHQPQKFDLLALDAFSSDAIPVHLLTREAFATYLQQLAPNGILAVHTSNRYLDLRPVVERLADEFGLFCLTISDDEHAWWVYPTTWILVTRDTALLDQDDIAEVAEFPVRDGRDRPLWTDDYASLFAILR